MRRLSWLQCRGGPLSGHRPLPTLPGTGSLRSLEDATTQIQCNLGQIAGSEGGPRTRVHKELGAVVELGV